MIIMTTEYIEGENSGNNGTRKYVNALDEEKGKKKLRRGHYDAEIMY